MKQLLKIVSIQLNLNLDIIQKYLNINMNKKGLRGFIRNRLPKTWEIVLTRERKLTAFIEYVYESTPSVMKEVEVGDVVYITLQSDTIDAKSMKCFKLKRVKKA